MPEKRETPSQDPRRIQHKTSIFEFSIRIDSPGMEKLTPTQRESMHITMDAVCALLYMSIDPTGLKPRGTISDVLKHLRYRTAQVSSAILEGTITEDPEKTNPSPATSMRIYAQEISKASINTQESIEATRQRILFYAKTNMSLSDIISQIESESKKPTHRRIVEGLKLTSMKLLSYTQGMAEALDRITGKTPTVPADIQEIVDFFTERPERQTGE